MIVSANLSFELGQQIGAEEGRNSKVFLAHDPQLGADIVVKQVPKQDFSDVDEFFAEARMLYDARHPNVAEVKYACVTDDHVYLAMPHYSGGSVQARMDQAMLTNREVVRFGLDFLHGLHHVHTRGMVHFDVKPSNILLSVAGVGALADFGLAKHLREDGLAEVDRLYFLHWPPEYMISGDLSRASDIFQAGLTFYRMLVGPAALERQAQDKTKEELMEAIAAGAFPDRSGFPLHVPRALADVVRKALELEPDDRFPTVLDLLVDLAAVNQLLDWRYFRNPSATSRTWEHTKEGQLRRVELRSADDGSWNVVSSKTNTETGKTRQQRKLAGERLSWGKARNLVTKALREME